MTPRYENMAIHYSTLLAYCVFDIFYSKKSLLFKKLNIKYLTSSRLTEMYLSWYIRKSPLQSFAEFSHLEGSSLSQLWCPFCCSDEKAWGSLPISAEEWATQTVLIIKCNQLYNLLFSTSEALVKCHLFTAAISISCILSLHPIGLCPTQAVSFKLPKHFIITSIFQALHCLHLPLKANRNPAFPVLPHIFG